MRYKAVLADVDGTLYRQDRVRRGVAARLLGFTLRHPVAGWRTIRALGAYRSAQEELRLTSVAGVAHRQVDEAARRSGYESAFVSACVQRWMETAPLDLVRRARFPGLLEFCEWARARELALGIVSDYDPRTKLRALGLEGYFGVVACAQDPEVGVFKPNPLGLELVLKRLGVAAENAVFVGDRLEVDGAVARAAGVACVILASARRRHSREPGIVFADGWTELRRLLETGDSLA